MAYPFEELLKGICLDKISIEIFRIQEVVYIHTYIHAYMHTCIHAYMHT